MKEATGELNMTVITVVAIAAVAAFFYAFVWPAIKDTIDRNTHCSQVMSCETPCTGSTCLCEYCEDADCSTTKTVRCPNKTASEGGGTTGGNNG